MSMELLKGRIDALKTANIFDKPAIAEATLDAAMDVMIEQAAEIENLSNCVNFLARTMDNLAKKEGDFPDA